MLRHAFLIAFSIIIIKPWIIKWISIHGLQTTNKLRICHSLYFPLCICTFYFVFVTKARRKSVFRENSKFIVIENKILRFFSCGYLTTHYSMVKCHRHVAKKFILSLQGEKGGRLWLNEYIKQNIIMTLLRKANFHSIDICKFMKNH